MLSSNNSSSITDNSSKAFESIIASIKAPLSDLYGKCPKFSLSEDLSDEQFQQLETLMDETIAEWRSRINLKSYTHHCLKEFKAGIDNNEIDDVDEEPDLGVTETAANKADDEQEIHSAALSEKGEDNVLSVAKTKIDNNDEASDEEKPDSETAGNKADEEKSDGEEQEVDFAEIEAAYKLFKENEKKTNSYSNDDDDGEKEEELNITDLINNGFNELSVKWNIEIKFTYNTTSFIKFISSTVSKNRIHSLLVEATLSEDAVDKILVACQNLPKDSIYLCFNKDQDITDYQGKKIFLALKSLRHIDFTEKENTLSESTAKSLTYSKYSHKLRIEGYGVYHQLRHHVYLIKSCNMLSIFMNGEECTIEDIEKLLSGLKGSRQDFQIRCGNYTTPAWQYFFTKTLAENSCQVYSLEIGRLVDDNFTMSNEVISTIFTALKTNKSVWKLELRIALSLEQVTELANAILVNDNLQELHIRCGPLTAPMLSTLFSALIANPNGKVHTLCLNDSYLPDEAATEFKMLISLNTKLRKLMLGSTYIGKQTCKAIANALKVNKTLKMLSVFENNFFDEELTEFSAGLLENKTLEEFHIYQRMKFSPQGIESFLRFREQHYAAEFSIGLLTDQNLARSEEISARNRNIRLNARLKMLTAYTWMAVILYRDHYHGTVFSKVHKVVIENILSFFFPKGAEPILQRELIRKNMQEQQWQTYVEVTVPAQFPSWTEQTVVKPLFERWAAPGFQLKINAAIHRIKLNARADIDIISGQYIDLNTAAKLADAMQTNTIVTQLNLAMCRLDDNEFELIAAGLLRRSTPLTVLNLDHNNLTVESFPRIRQLLINGKVKNIMLFNNNDLKNDHEAVKSLKEIAKTYGAKIHFVADIKRDQAGFFAKNPARQLAMVADSKEEKSVNASPRNF